MNNTDGVFSALADVSRRDFMKLCTALAATMGLNSKAGAEMTAAMTSPARPPVLWIGAQECTGCTESLLRATHPTVENLVLDLISLEYHEVLSAAFGEQAEENKHNAIHNYYGKYVLVVDGSIPIKDGGVYCMVAGKPIVEHIREAAKGAAAIIAILKFYQKAHQLLTFLAALLTHIISWQPLPISLLIKNYQQWIN